ncbi:MAG: ATP-binding cassette domain-containing protein [Lachnospiraceae bacterium]|nr:ATP-binding cassette domain-containing protein [Lachnospiraceae bacterium]
MAYLLETCSLGKDIGKQKIIEDVSLHVKKGEIYGFLGPNGAGKTTILKLVTGLWKPTKGEIFLFGKQMKNDFGHGLKRMGIVLEYPAFYQFLSGRENLELHREYMGYYRHGSVEEALKLVCLEEMADRPVKDYSLGMKERLGIARAVLCKPEFLILDEPLNGLDPSGIHQIRELIRRLCQEYGTTVLMSSHILSEVETTADTVGILCKGKLKEEVSMKELSEKSASFIEVLATDRKRAAFVLEEKLNIRKFRIMEDGHIRVYDQGIHVERMVKHLAAEEVGVLSIGRKTETLEEYFMQLVGEDLQ